MAKHFFGGMLISTMPWVTAAGLSPRFAFVANSSDNTVSVYTVNASSGLLRANGYVVVKNNPTGMAVTPGGQFLYVVNSSSADVSGFSVNTHNGILTAISGSPFATRP